MARLKVNTITDRNNSGAPLLIHGSSFPPESQLNVQGNLNLTGVSTVGFLSVTNVNVGIITASSFIGDGSGLVAVPVVDAGKSIALKIVLDPLPFRS